MSKTIENPALAELRQIFDSNKGADSTLVISKRLAVAETVAELCAKICEERASYYESGDDDAPGSRRAGACQNCADVIRYRVSTSGLEKQT